jgi:hypothetical protein
VCAAWLGHTERIADAFYRQVTDEHFTRATAASEEAAQNPAQQPTAGARNTSHLESNETKNPAISGALREVAVGCEEPNKHLLGDEGLEPPTSAV